MAQYTHQKHSCMAFAFGIIKIYLHTFHFSRARLYFFSSFLFLRIYCGPRIRWQVYFHLLCCLRCFPSFDLNILDKRRRRKNNFLYPHYLCTDTHAFCMLMIYFIATLVSHVLSSSLEIYKTCSRYFLFNKKKF